MSARWVLFDIDHTLYDFTKVRDVALGHALTTVRRLAGDVDTPRLAVADLQRVRDAIAATAPPTRAMLDIRRESFRHVLAGLGLSGAALVAGTEDVTGTFLAHRFATGSLFDDVAPCLERLRATHQLGVVSNGNSHPDRIGLGDAVEVVFMADAVGARKPDPAIFRAALHAADAAPVDAVMVGDSLIEDVLGARAAGLHAVLLDRDGRHDPRELPDGVPSIRRLDELPGAMPHVAAA